MTHRILPTAAAAVLLGIALAPAHRAAAQDAAAVQPHSYRVTVDNDRVRVLEYNARPGFGVCGSGRHSHGPHLTVLLTPARVRVTAGGRSRVVAMPAGQSFWEPAVTHEVENVGGANVRSLIIEVKRPGGRS